jgi:hypothetical protein
VDDGGPPVAEPLRRSGGELGLVAGFLGWALVPNDVLEGTRDRSRGLASIMPGLVGVVGWLIFTAARGVASDRVGASRWRATVEWPQTKRSGRRSGRVRPSESGAQQRLSDSLLGK